MNERERRIISALATGIEIGYGEEAADRFERLVANVSTLVGQRTGIPEEEGPLFFEALLVTNL